MFYVPNDEKVQSYSEFIRFSASIPCNVAEDSFL